MNVYLAHSPISGFGVFAVRNFEPGEHILSFLDDTSRQVFSYARTLTDTHRDEGNFVQIGFDKYIYPRPPSLYLNHSCDPNTGVQFATELVALLQIEARTELTFDYSTCVGDDPWEMVCRCGALNCRGRIGEFKLLPVDRQFYYLSKRVVPDFCLGHLSAVAAGSA